MICFNLPSAQSPRNVLLSECVTTVLEMLTLKVLCCLWKHASNSVYVAQGQQLHHDAFVLTDFRSQVDQHPDPGRSLQAAAVRKQKQKCRSHEAEPVVQQKANLFLSPHLYLVLFPVLETHTSLPYSHSIFTMKLLKIDGSTVKRLSEWVSRQEHLFSHWHLCSHGFHSNKDTDAAKKINNGQFWYHWLLSWPKVQTCGVTTTAHVSLVVWLFSTVRILLQVPPHQCLNVNCSVWILPQSEVHVNTEELKSWWFILIVAFKNATKWGSSHLQLTFIKRKQTTWKVRTFKTFLFATSCK